MTYRLLSGPVAGSALVAGLAALFMAAAPIASASAQMASGYAARGWGYARHDAVEADSDCGTMLARPPYANGFTEQACQGVVPGWANSPELRFINQ